MQKTTKIILWISIGIIVITLILLSLVLFLDLSWWWLFAPLIAITVIVIVLLVIFLIRKRHLDRKLEEEKPKEQAIDPETANRIIEYIALKEFLEYLPNGQEKVTYEGSAGKPKTPVFHKFGDTYWGGLQYYFLLNLNNPKMITKLFQEEIEGKKEFDERVKQATLKFAVEPEIFETEEIYPEPVTGRTIIKRKKQTIAEIQKEKEEKEAEQAEEI